MIICKICNQEFNNVISWKHLKTHNMNVDQYKIMYGSVVSDEYRKLKSLQSSGVNNPMFGKKHSNKVKEKISLLNKGKVPPNKDKPMSQDQKDVLSTKAVERNKKWKENLNHPLLGRQHTNKTKEKIKKKRANQIITTESALKAVETKIKKGYNLAFFKGKKHSNETKEKISKSSKIFAQKKSSQSLKECKKRLEEYNYTLVSSKQHIIDIQCNICKTVFSRTKQYSYSSKIYKELCPTCFPPLKGDSLAQQEICNFLKDYTNIRTKDRTLISPKELDIVLVDFNIAIEYNGLYWHSELFKDKTYHLEKTNIAKDKGIRLIHIFEDEWDNRSEIVKSRLLSLIKANKNKIYARQCEIKEIDSKVANKFLNENHLQGSGRSNIRLGLFYNNELISVMTFLKGDISKNIKEWELNRFCSKTYMSVVGGAGKLFTYFVKKYNPSTIISFSDKRWSDDNTVYQKLNFLHARDSVPNYWYFFLNDNKRYHRYSLKKPKNSTISEKELRSSQKYFRIYDCGSSKWIWSK